jgi:hypothetical protein
VQFTRRLVKGGRVLNSGVCSFCAGFVLDTFPVGTGPAKSNDIKLPIPSPRPVLTVERTLSIPDSPQRPVRLRALKEGKMVYMAVPRLRELECFIELDPSRLGRNIKQAASIRRRFPIRPLRSSGQYEANRLDRLRHSSGES